MRARDSARVVLVALLPALAGGCNILSGLSDLQVTGGGAGATGGTSPTGGTAGTAATAGTSTTTAGTGGTSPTAGTAGTAGTTGGTAGTTSGTAGTAGTMAPTCDDKTWNGNETDIDCGGLDCPKCDLGKNCTGHSDCASDICFTHCLKVDKLAAGNAHACALLSTGELYCWGSNGHGQLGTGSASTSAPPSAAAMDLIVIDVVAGGPPDDKATAHTCAINKDKRLFCWGANLNGQLGTNNTNDLSSPPEVPILSGVEGVAAGGAFSCAIKMDFKVACWGTALHGELANGSGNDSVVPKDTSLTDVAALSAGARHGCALFKDGGVSCWGDNNRGQVGSNLMGSALPITAVDVLGVTALSSAADSNCALAGGDVTCWGDNTDFELTDAVMSTFTSSPTLLSLNGATAVALGGDGDKDAPNDPTGGHACAVLSSGKVTCWGNNRHGQLGRGMMSEMEASPAEISGLSGVLEVVSGDEFSCARLGTGAVRCWGRNDFGQLGTSMPGGAQSSPVPVVWP
jgi:hypothetical protein